MVDTAQIVNLMVSQLERQFRIINAQAQGITHEESLMQYPFRGNCFNWVVGHILMSRDRMLRVVQAEPVWTPSQWDRYERNSEPITSADDPEVIHFDKIMADLKTAHERLIECVKALTDEQLDAVGVSVIDGAREQSVFDWLTFLIWHEGYHVGQLEITRQLTGKNDKII